MSAEELRALYDEENVYESTSRDAVYPDYVCDEVDGVNADYPVAAVYYGVVGEFVTQNPDARDILNCM